MQRRGSLVTVLSAVISLTYNAIAFAQTTTPTTAGEVVYKQRCSACHDQANPRIPPRSALNQMSARRILRALDFGAMMTVAYPMTRDEREAVSAYLGTPAPATSFPASAYCSDRRVAVSAMPK